VQILEDNNIDYSIIEYIKNGISHDEIRNICNILNIKPRDIIRETHKSYKELNISTDNEQDDIYMINLIIRNPKILQRPIILGEGKGVIGRPPEKINELLK